MNRTERLTLSIQNDPNATAEVLRALLRATRDVQRSTRVPAVSKVKKDKDIEVSVKTNGADLVDLGDIGDPQRREGTVFIDTLDDERPMNYAFERVFGRIIVVGDNRREQNSLTVGGGLLEGRIEVPHYTHVTLKGTVRDTEVVRTRSVFYPLKPEGSTIREPDAEDDATQESSGPENDAS